mmetsp:Transcript_22108/g.30841  ORF Transcript_22108/g.30841 Transcript_22108/m.30841 type:complete len:170 (-) Transcript_22108:348-857(-)
MEESKDGDNHLLITLDESEYGKKLVDYCIKFLCSSATKITLLHAYQYVPVSTIPGHIPHVVHNSDSLNKKLRAHAQMRATSLLEYSKEKIIKSGITVPIFTEAVIGEPHHSTKQVLLDSIEKANPTLVACGSRGMGYMGRMFLGSVSDFLVHNTKCTVLVVKSNDLEEL